MTELLKPLHLLQHEGGKTSFFFIADAFYHNPMMSTLSQITGTDRDYFNGYAWEKLISKLIMAEFSERAEEIILDPEADIFSAISENHELMLQLALRFQTLMQDKKALLDLVG